MKKLTEISKKERLNIAFLYVETRIQNIENDFLKKSNLKITHRELIYIVLINLFKDEKMSTIAKIIGISKSTFSNMVNTLIRKGMINKKRISQDSRILTLELTKKSTEALEIHMKARDIVNNSIKEMASNSEKDTLNSISDKVIKLIKKDLNN